MPSFLFLQVNSCFSLTKSKKKNLKISVAECFLLVLLVSRPLQILFVKYTFKIHFYKYIFSSKNLFHSFKNSTISEIFKMIYQRRYIIKRVAVHYMKNQKLFVLSFLNTFFEFWVKTKKLNIKNFKIITFTLKRPLSLTKLLMKIR